MSFLDEYERDKALGCTCNPPHSSIPSRPDCPIHCLCMSDGRSLYDPKIDGSCRRCGKYPAGFDSYVERLK